MIIVFIHAATEDYAHHEYPVRLCLLWIYQREQ